MEITTDLAKKKSRQDKRQDRARLREIISILRKHKIIRGLTPKRLRFILEDLGTTYMKLGQLLSTRDDLLPQEYVRELSKLRTEVSYISQAEIRQLIEEECGAPMESLFSSFEEAPLGAASIAQVHSAVLKNGKSVVVKVQRPGIYEIMERDLSLFVKAASIIKKTGVTGDIIDFNMVINEIWQVAKQELNFITEADNLEEFKILNQSIVYIDCPLVYRKYSSKHVLVMEYIKGIAISEKQELIDRGYDLTDLGEKLAESYVKQIMEDAFFHADPHPGNIIIREGQIVFIDMGMMGRLKARERDLMKHAMHAILEHDIMDVKDVLLTLGVPQGQINHARLYADIDAYITRYGTMSLKEINALSISQLLNELLDLAKQHGIALPDGMTMLGRGIILLESLLTELNADIDFITILANHVSGSALSLSQIEKMVKDSGSTAFTSLKKGLEVPARLSDLIKMTVKGQTKINYEISSSQELKTTLITQVNKLILCILAVTFLIAGCLLSMTTLPPVLWGLPGLACLMFFLSAICIVWLLLKMRKER